jgi:uncharacterized protein YqeY
MLANLDYGPLKLLSGVRPAQSKDFTLYTSGKTHPAVHMDCKLISTFSFISTKWYTERKGGPMALKDTIAADLKAAMLEKDEAQVTVLRGLKAVILDAEVADGKREEGLSDTEIEKLIAKEVKKRNEAIDMYEANGRGDLVESESFEKKVLEKYLPTQMSEAEISAKINEILGSLAEGEIAQMGTVIGKVKMLVGNAADGATIARLVKEKLS